MSSIVSLKLPYTGNIIDNESICNNDFNTIHTVSIYCHCIDSVLSYYNGRFPVESSTVPFPEQSFRCHTLYDFFVLFLISRTVSGHSSETWVGRKSVSNISHKAIHFGHQESWWVSPFSCARGRFEPSWCEKLLRHPEISNFYFQRLLAFSRSIVYQGYEQRTKQA